MNAVILDGSLENNKVPDTVRAALTDELAADGWTVDTMVLRDLNIAYCVGCFECWVKTPGMCRFNDDGREVARRFIQSDLVVFLTPVSFGGYSSALKRGLDRIICLISPFFKQVRGETHHRLRYNSYPRVLALGTMPEADPESERIFCRLVERNAINVHSPGHAADVFVDNEETAAVRHRMHAMLDRIGVVS
ncbi:MAG: NAD(P)H-dependent oxidoreductase [candidate division Zixibacteria bacterium]|nr:NAD(P)H-dependent oxidoreductase [candidate division Zixibacteria bacterium]